MKKKMFVLAFGLFLAFGLQGQFAQLDPISVDPPDGGGLTCTAEQLSCGWGNGTRQICHENGGKNSVGCVCGTSTKCP